MIAALLAATGPAATEDTTFQWVLVLCCWGVVLVSIGLLVLRTSQRGRRLAKQVPPEQRRWM